MTMTGKRAEVPTSERIQALDETVDRLRNARTELVEMMTLHGPQVLGPGTYSHVHAAAVELASALTFASGIAAFLAAEGEEQD